MKIVMVSSTILDLPEHRREVQEACQRRKMVPLMMEHLSALNKDAVKASIEMVNKAHIYLGVLGCRYGYRPKGYSISITEMEYNRAVERDIPRLLFVMSPNHLIKFSEVEFGSGAIKLKALKARFEKDRVCAYFDSPVDLRAHDRTNQISYQDGNISSKKLFVSSSRPPLGEFVDREKELQTISDWITGANPTLRNKSAFIIIGVDRGLIVWDRTTNHYTIHPVISTAFQQSLLEKSE